MKEKYLPIGTICTLKNKDKNIMITGYFSIEYNGNVKMYEYSGIVYPEGYLLPSQTYSFNHSDIAEVKFMGYKNEQFTIFNNSLNRNKEESNTRYQKKEFMSNLKFDENGVVVFDGVTELKTENTQIEQPVTNPFQEEFVGVQQEKSKSVFNFDSEGTVISENGATSDVTTKPRYKFDANGYVISEELEMTNASNYQFDENGIVIEEYAEEPKSVVPYKFDEDGVVIEDDFQTELEALQIPISEVPPIKFDANGYVVSE